MLVFYHTINSTLFRVKSRQKAMPVSKEQNNNDNDSKQNTNQ